MPRLLALLAVGAACAAALDPECDQRAELFDDVLDEAEPLIAPDHAAEAAAEAFTPETAAALEATERGIRGTLPLKAALEVLGVDLATLEDLVEPEVSDERGGGGLEAAAEAAAALEASTLPAKEKKPYAKAGTIRFLDDDEEAAAAEEALEDPYLAVEPTREVERLEPEVFDDELAPLVARVARGPPSKEEDFEALARDVADFARLKTSTSEDVVDFVRWGSQGAREADDDIDEVVATEAGAEVAEQAPELYAPRTRRSPVADEPERTTEDVEMDEIVAAEAGAAVAEQALNEFISKAPELYGLMRRTDLVDDAPDDDLGGLFKFVKGLGGGETERAAVDDAPPAAPLRAPDLEYDAWDDDEVERAAQVGYVGPRCTDCTCRSWGRPGYSECRPTTAADPCDGYCVKCEEDGRTPMPGLWMYHAQHCEKYEGMAVTFGEDWWWAEFAKRDTLRSSDGHVLVPPYALPDSYPKWFRVLYRQPWILWGQLGQQPWIWRGVREDPFACCMLVLSWVVIAAVGFAVGRATAGRKRADEVPPAASLAALARQEGYSDLAEKGMSPYITPRGRGRTVRLTAMPMPSPASVAERDY